MFSCVVPSNLAHFTSGPGSFLSRRALHQVVEDFHIAQVLAHSTLRMSERCSHLAPANAIAAEEKLEGVPKPGPTAPAGVGAST